MIFGRLVPASLLLLPQSALGFKPTHSTNSPNIRLNHIQVIGTHNSYHREITLSERPVFEKLAGPLAKDFYYSHSDLTHQLQHQGVRSLELDLHSDEKGGLYYPPLIWTLSNLTNATTPFDGSVLLKPGIKVFHVTDFDTDAVCHTFVDCLTELKTWSDSNRNHVPIIIDLELKTDALACSRGGVCAEEATNWTLPRLLNVDAEILSVFPRSQLLVPDDVRKGNMTLEESVLQHGWPLLNDVRGRFMFFFDNDPSNSTSDPGNLYTSNNHTSLQNRTVFTNALEGSPDAAVIKYNNPIGANLVEINRLVTKGYIVRTRADEPITTVLSRNTTMRDSALKSGAQVISTDFPAWGMAARWGWDYTVTLDRGRVVRCNAISASKGCQYRELE